MAFAYPRNSRERILAFGGAGGGKSYQFLHILKRLAKSGSKAQGFVICTDRAYERDAEAPEFEILLDQGTLEYEIVKDWDATMKTLDSYLGQVKRDDWISVDLAGPTWQFVQQSFTERVYGTDKSEWLVQIARDVAEGREEQHKKKRGGFEGRKDWGVINAMYGDFAIPLLVEANCHVYITAEEDKLGDDDFKENKELRNIFEDYGKKPKCQKSIPHFSHTILHFGMVGGHYVVNTLRDRGGREKMEGLRVDDRRFDRFYLEKVAGWRDPDEKDDD